MAMTVMHNNMSMAALGELQKNNRSLGKTLKKVATGMRLNSAGDGASAYAISERMRVQLRTLSQDEQNVKNGRDLLAVADGGIQNIIAQLRTMKELAINAANDTNTDADRATIQKEFDARRDGIEEIAVETNYNGKRLLDGSWWRYRKETSASTSKGTQQAITTTPPARPTGNVTIIASGNYTISQDGVYKLDSGYTGNITITTKNVELQQTDKWNQDVTINCTTPGTALWLNSMQITNSTASSGKSFLSFTGTGNTLQLLGGSMIHYSASSNATVACVNIGDGLAINDGGLGDGVLDVTYSAGSNDSGAGIGTDGAGGSAQYLVINSGKVLSMASSSEGAAIGSGGTGSHIGRIEINGGTVIAAGSDGAAIGSGASGSSVDHIVINGGDITRVLKKIPF